MTTTEESSTVGGAKRVSMRLAILQASLERKTAEMDARLSAHFAAVKEANGQPLNDKRNGAATLSKWKRQDEAIRRVRDGIEKTRAAIEREQAAIARVDAMSLPAFITEALAAGQLTQWRKYPNRFFVPGVEKGRIVWDAEKSALMHSHLADVPKDQYPKFRDTFNHLRRQAGQQ